MPTYDYECTECDNRFERFQSMTARPLRKCPKCGGRVKRLLGTGGLLLFKGSGFYETDYKRAAAPKTETGDSAAPAPPKPTDKPASTAPSTPPPAAKTPPAKT